MIRNVLSGIAAVSLGVTPAIAQAASPARASAPVKAESELSGQSTLFFVLGILAVAAAIFLLIDDDDNSVSA
jgi:hypothetical protein